MPDKKNRRKLPAVAVAFIIIVIMALIGFAGLLMSRNDAAPLSSVPEQFVSYPTVSSSVASSRDGKSHSIDIDLVVEYSDGTQNTVSHDAVYKDMEQAVSGMDYEGLKTEDSVENIESAVKDALNASSGKGNVAKVYVANIAIDFPGWVDNTKETPSDSREKLKGLFKNLQE